MDKLIGGAEKPKTPAKTTNSVLELPVENKRIKTA
jgi:hypothetical protein